MSSSPTDRHQQILDDLTPALAPLQLRVEDLTVTPAGKRRVVRVLVDTDLAGLDPTDETSSVPSVDLDAVGEATRVISDRLDQTDAMGEQPYVLEVSSPGVDRPLTQPHHYRRNVGRLVTVSRTEGGDITGRIMRAGADDFDLLVTPDKGEPALTTLPYAECGKSKVNVEFNRPEEGEH
ncbi:ribosome maturation factor RimP [Yimella sp. cx-573]|nr:ribosome maturation factor RimP [Yimella sp. cx-573]